MYTEVTIPTPYDDYEKGPGFLKDLKLDKIIMVDIQSLLDHINDKKWNPMESIDTFQPYQ